MAGQPAKGICHPWGAHEGQRGNAHHRVSVRSSAAAQDPGGCDRTGPRHPDAYGLRGTIDLYFAAKAPAGKEKNWLATVAGRGFFAIIRLYSPTEGAFDGSWKPSDFHEVE